jgi:hypothetical protein
MSGNILIFFRNKFEFFLHEAIHIGVNGQLISLAFSLLPAMI